jgi:hypothetical protein
MRSILKEDGSGNETILEFVKTEKYDQLVDLYNKVLK